MRQSRHDSPRRNDSIRAAIYTRISFDDTGREEGVERQEHDCRAWADAHEWPVVKVFCDNSISASKFDVMRPEYDKLCDAVSSGEVNAVVYWDLDRLTRQQGQLEWWLNQSKRGRVRMADPKGGELVADTAEQRLTISMRGLFSYFEVEHKSERQVAANDPTSSSALARDGLPYFLTRLPREVDVVLDVQVGHVVHGLHAHLVGVRERVDGRESATVG